MKVWAVWRKLFSCKGFEKKNTCNLQAPYKLHIVISVLNWWFDSRHARFFCACFATRLVITWWVNTLEATHLPMNFKSTLGQSLHFTHYLPQDVATFQPCFLCQDGRDFEGADGSCEGGERRRAKERNFLRLQHRLPGHARPRVPHARDWNHLFRKEGHRWHWDSCVEAISDWRLPRHRHLTSPRWRWRSHVRSARHAQSQPTLLSRLAAPRKTEAIFF